MPVFVKVSSLKTFRANSGSVSAWVNASLASHQFAHHHGVGIVLGEDADVPLELVDVAIEGLQALSNFRVGRQSFSWQGIGRASCVAV
jgi:hypothetical protein